jgi:hypothetical protein
LYDGGSTPGAARLLARARAHAFTASVSGEACEVADASATAVENARVNLRIFMEVFLVGG